MGIRNRIFSVLSAGLFLFTTQANAVLVEGVTPSLKFKIIRVKDDGTQEVATSPVSGDIDRSSSTIVNATPGLVLAADTGRIGSGFCNYSQLYKLFVGNAGIQVNAGFFIQPQTCDSLDGNGVAVADDIYAVMEGTGAANISYTVLKRQ